MQIGNTDINAKWVASKTEEEVIKYFMRKWADPKKLHPAFARRNEQQRIDYIKAIYASAKAEAGPTTAPPKGDDKGNKKAATV